jgi:sec-independent protein translocase protein TatB
MLDLGLDKLALIGVVALIVLGPEKLPRVARTVGNLMGRAQRYVADVKSEVNRQMDLEELKKMKTEMESAAQDVQQTIHKNASVVSDSFESSWKEATAGLTHDSTSDASSSSNHSTQSDVYYGSTSKPKRNTFRLKQTAVPHWYKQRSGIKSRAQSGAARVARYRPKTLVR